MIMSDFEPRIYTRFDVPAISTLIKKTLDEQTSKLMSDSIKKMQEEEMNKTKNFTFWDYLQGKRSH